MGSDGENGGGQPDIAAALEAMRRAVAGAYPGCWNGNACPHPMAASCAWLEAAGLAFKGLPAVRSGFARLLERLSDPAFRVAFAAQVEAQGVAPMWTEDANPGRCLPRRT